MPIKYFSAVTGFTNALSTLSVQKLWVYLPPFAMCSLCYFCQWQVGGSSGYSGLSTNKTEYHNKMLLKVALNTYNP